MNFALPRKAWVSTIKKEAQELNLNFLYDSRATLAVMKSSAGFHSNLTNPSTRWWQSGMIEDKYMQSGRAQKYFRECDDIQYDVMNASNFNRSMMEFYPNLLSRSVFQQYSQKQVQKRKFAIHQYLLSRQFLLKMMRDMLMRLTDLFDLLLFNVWRDGEIDCLILLRPH